MGSNTSMTEFGEIVDVSLVCSHDTCVAIDFSIFGLRSTIEYYIPQSCFHFDRTGVITETRYAAMP